MRNGDRTSNVTFIEWRPRKEHVDCMKKVVCSIFFMAIDVLGSVSLNISPTPNNIYVCFVVFNHNMKVLQMIKMACTLLVFKPPRECNHGRSRHVALAIVREIQARRVYIQCCLIPRLADSGAYDDITTAFYMGEYLAQQRNLQPLCDAAQPGQQIT